MEIGAGSQAYSGSYANSAFGVGSGTDVSPSNDSQLSALKSKASDPDGNPYYDDPKQSKSGMPIFGYRRDDLLETGVGSDASKGIAGLGDSLAEYRERTGAAEDASVNNLDATSDGASESDEALKAFRNRDNEVRAHEAAHLAAAGGLARGGMQLSYQIGPDGKPYAVGGSVQIDTSEGSTPQETLKKAAQIEAAATAPANPSPQDLKVAAQARRMAAEARQEIADEQRENQNPPAEGADPTGKDARAEVISRTYGVAVSQDVAEPAFVAVA